MEEEEEGPWELGFIVTPSSSFCEARELFEVFKEVAVLPATRFWDLVRFKSAKVPGGKCYDAQLYIAMVSWQLYIEKGSSPSPSLYLSEIGKINRDRWSR